jgi:leucine dehydrogenase
VSQRTRSRPGAGRVSPARRNGAPADALVPPGPFEHEELAIRRGRRSGLYSILAVHSTALGPALGGCRLWHYPSVQWAVGDALRLSRTMTLKASAAGLDLGGGKGVVCLRRRDRIDARLRERILLDVAEAVDALGGRYVTAEDVGTSARDMVTIARGTRHVVGLPAELGGSGDPSPFTAAGVVAAMRACCAERFGSPALAGRSVAVIGCGRVGEQLARGLANLGAELALTDILPAKRELAAELDARWLHPENALHAEVDVLAPCALGGLIDGAEAARLRCRIVCGAANNPLAHDGVADVLADLGILYAPDFIVNAGGLVNVSMELSGYDPERVRRRVAGIEERTARILSVAAGRGITPLAAAHDLAAERLGPAVPARAS